MAILRWHGHSCFEVTTVEGAKLLFDPFLDENPVSDIRADDIETLDYILCSHGHWDHFQDAIPLAKRTGALLIGAFELVGFAGTKGVENAHALHIGGGATFPFGYAKMTPAMHGGQIAGDDEGVYTTHAGGFWIRFNDGKRLYHAGDTALLMDMQLLRGQVDVALLPIGDNFTMGPDDAARAVEFIEPGIVVPMHYNTWPPIRQDPHDFARKVGSRAIVRILEVGDTLEF
jgi:L-ascorbate metabolism protein UlaG (beta-lactamase superfamily)